MKEETMTLKEFINFKKEAKKNKVQFDAQLQPDLKFLVKVDAAFLDKLGF